jgi:hypothetical protein
MTTLLTIISPDGSCTREFIFAKNRPQRGECLRFGSRIVRVVEIVHEVYEFREDQWGELEAENDREHGAEILAVPFEIQTGIPQPEESEVSR